MKTSRDYIEGTVIFQMSLKLKSKDANLELLLRGKIAFDEFFFEACDGIPRLTHSLDFLTCTITENRNRKYITHKFLFWGIKLITVEHKYKHVNGNIQKSVHVLYLYWNISYIKF